MTIDQEIWGARYLSMESLGEDVSGITNLTNLTSTWDTFREEAVDDPGIGFKVLTEETMKWRNNLLSEETVPEGLGQTPNLDKVKTKLDFLW